MSGDYVVWRSEFVANREEARQYYNERFAGAHPLRCHGKRVSLYFPNGYTHFYSESDDESRIRDADRVTQKLPGGRLEVRRFSLIRANLMDAIIPAVTMYSFVLPGRPSQNREIYGQRLATGEYLCVIVRPTAQPLNWTAISAYPVPAAKWRQARMAKTARFPP